MFLNREFFYRGKALKTGKKGSKTEEVQDNKNYILTNKSLFS